MKKLLLSLALIIALIVTATACQTSDAPPSADRTLAASTKSTSDTDLPKPTQSTVTTTTVTTRPVTTPPVTDNREIVYDRWEGLVDFIRMYSCESVKNKIDDYDDMGFPAALCLVTVTEIETTDYAPVHVTIERIYQSTDEFEYNELDTVTGANMSGWREENGKYHLIYDDYEIPISREGYQYIVFIEPVLAGNDDNLIHTTIDEDDKYEYLIFAMTIPINENIDDEDYVNEWYEILDLQPGYSQKYSEEFLETFYRSSTEAQ